MSAPVVQLADLEEIRELARRYCRGLDREDVDMLKSVFWADATDDHGALFCGPAWEFADTVLQRRTRVRPTLHCVFNHSVELGATGVTAKGEVYSTGYQFRHALPDPHTRVVVGRYLDDYEKRDGRWRISQRVYVLEGTFTEGRRQRSTE